MSPNAQNKSVEQNVQCNIMYQSCVLVYICLSYYFLYHNFYSVSWIPLKFMHELVLGGAHIGMLMAI